MSAIESYEMPEGWYRPDGSDWNTVGEQAHALFEARRKNEMRRCAICKSSDEHTLSCPVRWYR